MSETLLCPQESNLIRWNGVASLLKAGEGLVGLPDVENVTKPICLDCCNNITGINSRKAVFC